MKTGPVNLCPKISTTGQRRTCLCDKRPISNLDLLVVDRWLQEGDSLAKIAKLTNRDLEHLREYGRGT